MSDLARSFLVRRRSVAMIPVPGAILLAIFAVLPSAAYAASHSWSSAGGATSSSSSTSTTSTPPSAFYDSFSSIKWLDPYGTVLATSSGVNVSQNSTFATSVVLACPSEVSVCSGAANVTRGSAQSLGNWPSWVSPCGYLRFTVNITASNLPSKIPSGGTTTIRLTLQAPIATYPNAAYVPIQFDYSGWVDVTLSFGP